MAPKEQEQPPKALVSPVLPSPLVLYAAFPGAAQVAAGANVWVVESSCKSAWEVLGDKSIGSQSTCENSRQFG